MTKYVLSLSVENRDGVDFHGYWDGKVYHSREYQELFPGVFENPNEDAVKKYSSIVWAEKAQRNFYNKIPGFIVEIKTIE